MNKIKLLSPILGIATLASASTATIACAYKAKAPVANSFEEDPWSTVAYYANKGLDALCKAYSCKAENFIGKQRKITLNGCEHKVIVIGTNQDQYKSKGKTYNAALTFQFDNLVSAKNEDASISLHVPWTSSSTDGNKNYWDTFLEIALNSTTNNVTWWNYSSEKRSVYTMLKDSDPKNLWTKNIKHVSRSVCVYKNDEWSPETHEVNIFVPTISNIYSESGITNTDDTYFSEYAEKILSEGQPNITNKQYAYYALPGNVGEINAKTNVPVDCLRKKGIDGYYGYYWFATPAFKCLSTEFTQAFSLTENSSHGYTNIISTASSNTAVCPCFCL